MFHKKGKFLSSRSKLCHYRDGLEHVPKVLDTDVAPQADKHPRRRRQLRPCGVIIVIWIEIHHHRSYYVSGSL